MIISIYGASAVGKTAIAECLATNLSLPLRSCGSEVRIAAKQLRVGLQNLPLSVHREIDAKTVGWVLERDPCIVEGRFLDQVLFGIPRHVYSVKLMATEEVRLARSVSRAGSAIEDNEVKRSDVSDQEFREKSYGLTERPPPTLTIDTSKLTVVECVNQITTAIRVL
jgi:cytidylate kinase